MQNIEREDIQIISRHSSMSEDAIDKVLKESIYSSKEDWGKFLSMFFMSLGIAFAVSGLVFFFAYNWADLHKFVKLGLTEGLIIVTTALALYPKISANFRNIILTGASVLVGVLFAVFGQIYQTGANAYDFFLAWTIFVTLWVIVSNFAPLWLLYLVLINTSLLLYSQQVARDWSELFVVTLLFVVNVAVVITALLISKYKKFVHIPNWFLNTMVLITASIATFGIIMGIFDRYHLSFPILILLVVATFTLGIWHGLKMKSIFFLAVILFCLIIIISALLVKISSGEVMFLLVSIFIVGSVTLVIKNLIDIQKKWTNEN